MNKGQNSGGPVSSADLARYFDAEDRNAIRTSPKIIFTTGALFDIGVLVLNSLAF